MTRPPPTTHVVCLQRSFIRLPVAPVQSSESESVSSGGALNEKRRRSALRVLTFQNSISSAWRAECVVPYMRTIRGIERQGHATNEITRRRTRKTHPELLSQVVD